MTISELIPQLEAIRAEHGDLPVWTGDSRDPEPLLEIEDGPYEQSGKGLYIL
jgi:hypothetical protein